MMTALTDTDLAELITSQLPRLLTERPELDTQLYQIFVRHFVDKGEWGRFRQEMAEFRTETQANFQKVGQRFEQVDQRFEQVDQRFEQVETSIENLRTEMRDEFKVVHQKISHLEGRVEDIYHMVSRIGNRWGIRNEALFRNTMKSLLEESFGVTVESRYLGPDDEQFDVIISNGDHILIEIAASVKRTILERLERKRALYHRETSIMPARFILAVGSIHSQRADALRQAGFEVIEPDDEED